MVVCLLRNAFVPSVVRGAMASERLVDVRPIPPRDRHALIFGTFEALRPGEALELVNDHDPKPLRYQFAAERENTFTWTYLESGPEVWRVEIRKTR